jgi:hypothetical protein
VTRYTGGVGTQGRILAGTDSFWLHGHQGSTNGRGKARYSVDFNFEVSGAYTKTATDWLVLCGKNSVATPGNIVADGIAQGDTAGGQGSQQLFINSVNNEFSSWALHEVCVAHYRSRIPAPMLRVSEHRMNANAQS